MQYDKDLQSIQEARDLVKKAVVAQKKLADFSQNEIDKIVKAMYEAAMDSAERLADMAVKETGFGIYKDKIQKNIFAAKNVYESIKDLQTVGILYDDKENKIMEIAAPWGVVAGVIPSTNPTSTTIFKALIAVKGGNSIVFSPHPGAKKCIYETSRILYEAALKAGAPEGLIGCMTNVTMAGTNELFHNRDVALILATGGAGLVKAAYSSGKPAFGVGPGNVPAFVERSADVKHAAKCIIIGKTFDNGTICASEQAIVADKMIKDELVRELKNYNAYFLSDEEKAKLEKYIVDCKGNLNVKIVGKPAAKIAKDAGFSVPENTSALIGFEENVGDAYPLSREKLSPILGFYTVNDWVEGCEKSIELLQYGGIGHSLVIHSTNEEVIKEFGLKKPVSRLLVNTPSSHGAIGLTTNLAPSLTLGCGSFGNNITSDNITAIHMFNIKRVAYGISEVEYSGKENVKVNTITANAKNIDNSGTDIDKLIDDILAKLRG